MLPSSKPFRLGLVQMRCSPDPDDNLRRACDGLKVAADRGAKVGCLPELFRTQYFCQTEDHAHFDLAESIPGPTTEALSAVAREKAMVVVGTVFERRAPGVYHNTAVVIDADGEIAGLYRKMHIPDDPGYNEKFYFTPGDTGFVSIATQHAQVGPLICWDQWFPEAARLTAMRGAEILIYPTAIGWHPEEKADFGASQVDAWMIAQRAHAIANGVYVAAVNRIGHEGPDDAGIEFWGGSFVIDPFGRIVARAGVDTREILLVDCDPRLAEQTRQHWPFLRDRRIDAYESLTKRILID